MIYSREQIEAHIPNVDWMALQASAVVGRRREYIGNITPDGKSIELNHFGEQLLAEYLPPAPAKKPARAAKGDE